MNNKGYALPVVLVILALLFTISAALLTQVRGQFAQSKDFLDYETALLIAQNAFVETEAALNKDPDYKGTAAIEQDQNGGQYEIEVKRVSEKERYITIKSKKEKYQKSFEGKAEINPETGKVIKLSWYMTK